MEIAEALNNIAFAINQLGCGLGMIAIILIVFLIFKKMG